MFGKLKPQNQRDIFKPMLRDFIDPRHELVVLAGQVDLEWIEHELSGKYSHTGQPSKPVRLFVGEKKIRVCLAVITGRNKKIT